MPWMIFIQFYEQILLKYQDYNFVTFNSVKTHIFSSSINDVSMFYKNIQDTYT